jgi:hypothetical protein
VVQQGPLVVVGGRLPDAVSLTSDELRAAVGELYDRIRETLEFTEARYPVRLWNFIPHIHEPMGSGLTRYMVFNAGRFKGYSQWFTCQGEAHDTGEFEGRIATASGVGHRGGDLLIHCLAAHHPGHPVENPRQRPAYHYSPLYGPLPPCFARATLLHQTPSGSPWLLVGGTASVLGEATAHGEDLERQVEETLFNLAALVASAAGLEPCVESSPCPRRLRELLGAFRHLRIYHPRQEHRAAILNHLGDRFHRVDHLEMIRADLCRPDLHVEIEGLVEIAPED